MYIIFDPVGPNRVKFTKDKIEELIADVSQWLLTHMPTFNGGKTEVLLIHSKYMYLEQFPPQKICNDLVHTGLSARNLGIFLDECLTMEKQISAVSQCGLFHLRNIAKSKCYLPEMSLLIVAYAFITNKMDGLLQLTVVWPP